MNENKGEYNRLIKMKDVAFPKAKYAFIATIIIIISINLIYYKDAIFN